MDADFQHVRAKQSSDQQPMSPARIAGWCITFAAMTAFIQIGIRLARYPFVEHCKPVVVDAFITDPEEMWWIVPLDQLGAYAFIALCTIVTARVFPRRNTAAALLRWFVFLLSAEILFLIFDFAIHPFATLILCLGLGIRIAKVPRLQRGLRCWPQRKVCVCAALVLACLPAGNFILRHLSSPRVRPANGPNVLLITLDTVRKQSMSLYGCPRATTPEIENFSRRAVVFQHAIAPSCWTLPTHASIFTGLPPYLHHAGYCGTNYIRDNETTLAEVLRAKGYSTAAFVANKLFCGGHTGMSQGFMNYDDRNYDAEFLCSGSVLTAACRFFCLGPAPLRRTASEINEHFFNWLSAADSRPFFVFLNYIDAHYPYGVPDPAFDRFSTLSKPDRQKYHAKWNDFSGANGFSFTPSEAVEAQFALDTYEATIAYLDHQIGRLLRKLEASGILDNTIVIITNDHGEHFGEHEKWEHNCSLYRQLIDAPLIIAYPKRAPSATVVDAPVSLAQIPATVLDLIGDGEKPFTGDSFITLLSRPTAPAEPIWSEVWMSEPTSAYYMRSVVHRGAHYIYRTDNGREELYDFANDPLESRDLAGDPNWQEDLLACRSVVRARFPGDFRRPMDHVAANSREGFAVSGCCSSRIYGRAGFRWLYGTR